jgi:hypothetical protein
VGVPFGTSVEVIEGVGPVVAADLAEIGIKTVFDVLLARPARLHRAVAAHASLEQVRDWQRMAGLLQVAAVDPQVAEALVKKKIRTVSALRHQPAADLQQKLEEAKQEGLIPTTPELIRIWQMLADAGVLDCCGVLAGVVRDDAGQPVADAELELADRTTRTDARGRFRLMRIARHSRPPLIVRHPNCETRAIDNPPIMRADSVGGYKIIVQRASGPVSAGTPLSELAGDALNFRAIHGWRSDRIQPDALREGDVLKVIKIDEHDGVHFTSMLRSSLDGRLIVHVLELPRASCPPDLEKGSHVKVSGGVLQPIAMTLPRMRRYRLRLQARRAIPAPPPGATVAEIDAVIRNRRAFLTARGYNRRP